MSQQEDGQGRVDGGALSQREQAQWAARRSIERALAAEQDAYETYQHTREQVAATIAHARQHDVPWAAICDALGGVTRSAAVQRLTTSRIGGANRPRASLAVPPGAKPPHLPTLLAEHQHNLTDTAARLWRAPQVHDAICARIDAETTQRRTNATLAGTPPEKVIIDSWRYARSRISDAADAVAAMTNAGITNADTAATELPNYLPNAT